MHNVAIGVSKQVTLSHSRLSVVLLPSKFHKKYNTHGSDECCEAMHFK